MRERLWLVKNGVPFDLAFSLDEITAAAWCIAFSEMEGHKFDWSSMSFKEQE